MGSPISLNFEHYFADKYNKSHQEAFILYNKIRGENAQ